MVPTSSIPTLTTHLLLLPSPRIILKEAHNSFTTVGGLGSSRARVNLYTRAAFKIRGKAKQTWRRGIFFFSEL